MTQNGKCIISNDRARYVLFKEEFENLLKSYNMNIIDYQDSNNSTITIVVQYF